MVQNGGSEGVWIIIQITTCTCLTYANNGQIATVPALLHSNNESALRLLRYIVVHQHGRCKTDVHGN